jgi:hypothetical protein
MDGSVGRHAKRSGATLPRKIVPVDVDGITLFRPSVSGLRGQYPNGSLAQLWL